MSTININQTNASETAKGIVEEATQAEVNAGTDTGGTGARLFAVPSKILSLLGSYLTTVSAAATYLTIVTAAATYQTVASLFASVMALVLTGFTAGANTAVAATDTLAQALAKFQGQINARPNETATTIATITNSTASKNPPIDADEVVGMDSASSFVLIRYSWTNIKAFLKTYFDTLYSAKTRSEFTGIAMSDETTVLGAASTSVPLATMHVPYAMILTKVYAGLRTAGTGASNCIVDIHLNGTSIMTTTKILFSASVKLSADGTLTTTALAAGDYLEFFLDQRDTNNVATGLKAYIVGYQ